MDTIALDTVLRQYIGKQRIYQTNHDGKTSDAIQTEIDRLNTLVIDTHLKYLSDE